MQRPTIWSVRGVVAFVAGVALLGACSRDGGPLEASDAEKVARESLPGEPASDPVVQIDGLCALITYDGVEPIVLGASDGQWFVVDAALGAGYDPTKRNCRTQA
jgi:hypothetical protein